MRGTARRWEEEVGEGSGAEKLYAADSPRGRGS